MENKNNPRCKTCRERFTPRYFGQKNCDENEKCIEAENNRKNEIKQKAAVKAISKPRVIKPIKKYVFKRVEVKKKSTKQKSIDKDYIDILQLIDSETEPKCTGCGKYQGGDIRLSHSHIISRADCKRISRPDLISDKRNITFHCLDFGDNIGCHGRHEQRDKSLLDWVDKLVFIEEICIEIDSFELLNKLIVK